MADTDKTILIVDDTPENITALIAVVSEFGKIKATTSGEKALSICAGNAKPDLIFLDVMMPGMDGWEVCRRLKADKATASIPIVFVTAQANNSDREHALSLGAAGLITKPLDPETVRDRIKSLVL